MTEIAADTGNGRDVPTPSQHGDGEDQQKSYRIILEQEMQLALEELERPRRGLLMSGLSAGLDIGFSILAVAVIQTMSQGQLPALTVQLLVAVGYSVGFIFVIFGRSELFTEHTTLAVLPVLGRRSTIPRLLRLWGLIFAANVAGTAAFAGLLAGVGPHLGVVDPAVLVAAATSSVAHPWWVIVLSAVLAGWMMGLVSWLVTAARSTISEIFFVTLVTSLIGLADLHHCIVGSVKMLAALFAGGAPGPPEYLRFMGLATAGNIVGGVVFVAVIKYAHATQTRERVFEAD